MTFPFFTARSVSSAYIAYIANLACFAGLADSASLANGGRQRRSPVLRAGADGCGFCAGAWR